MDCPRRGGDRSVRGGRRCRRASRNMFGLRSKCGVTPFEQATCVRGAPNCRLVFQRPVTWRTSFLRQLLSLLARPRLPHRAQSERVALSDGTFGSRAPCLQTPNNALLRGMPVEILTPCQCQGTPSWRVERRPPFSRRPWECVGRHLGPTRGWLSSALPRPTEAAGGLTATDTGQLASNCSAVKSGP